MWETDFGQSFFFLNTMFISLKIILKDNSLFKAKKERTMCYGVYYIWWNKKYDSDHKRMGRKMKVYFLKVFNIYRVISFYFETDFGKIK